MYAAPWIKFDAWKCVASGTVVDWTVRVVGLEVGEDAIGWGEEPTDGAEPTEDDEEEASRQQNIRTDIYTYIHTAATAHTWSALFHDAFAVGGEAEADAAVVEQRGKLVALHLQIDVHGRFLPGPVLRGENVQRGRCLLPEKNSLASSCRSSMPPPSRAGSYSGGDGGGVVVVVWWWRHLPFPPPAAAIRAALLRYSYSAADAPWSAVVVFTL